MVFVSLKLPSGDKTSVNTDNIKHATRFDENSHQMWLSRLGKSIKSWENLEPPEPPPQVLRDEAEMLNHVNYAKTNIHFMNGDVVSVRETLEEVTEILNAASKPGAPTNPSHPDGPGNLRKKFS